MTPHTPSHPLQLMSFEPDWMVMGRFFRGACTAEEAEAIARWEAASDANARLLAFMRQVWAETAIEWPAIDEAEAWKATRAKMAAATRPVVVRPLGVLPGGAERARASRRRLLVAGIAAAVLATAGAMGWRQVRATRAGAPPVQEYATMRGQRAELMLVDGTRVWLSVDTRLRVRPGYGGTARDVELEGEAYFRVVDDAARPFRVHTRGAVSQDLGTEFNVRAYPGEADERLLVTEGRVAMRPIASPAQPLPARDSAVELARGQMGQLDPDGRLTVVADVDPAAVIGWRDGQLRFKHTPIADAIRELERWYDLEIVLEDTALASVPLTATLGTQTADQALAVVANVLDAKYERRDRRVRLVPKPVPR